MAEIKKGRLGISRTTAILKQEGNNAVFQWQSADFPPNQQIAVFSIKCLVGYVQTASFSQRKSCTRLSDCKVARKPLTASTRESENSWSGLWLPGLLRRLTLVAAETMRL